MAETLPAGKGVPFEARLPCPVCVGVQMDKVALANASKAVVLDHCGRCGGVWFEQGEPQQLALHAPAELWQHIPPRQHLMQPPCHGCGTPLARDAHECGVCGRANDLRCPACDTMTLRVTHEGLTLDVCKTCKGVWFDHGELRSLWGLKLSEIARRKPPAHGTHTGDGGIVLLESLFWAPDIAFHGGDAIAAGAADVATGAAESVFEAIAGIISSVFDGLS